MGQITVTTCDIEGLKVIEPKVFGDDRGYFFESYNYKDYAAAGITEEFPIRFIDFRLWTSQAKREQLFTEIMKE